MLGAAILGTLGLIAGIWADKFDQLAAFQNFLIMPLTFLSGVFYSTHTLPPVWREVSRLNPVFLHDRRLPLRLLRRCRMSIRSRASAIVAGFFVVLAVVGDAHARIRGYKLRH